MPRPNPWRRDRTNPLIWLVAIICAVLAVLVIIAGIIIFSIYMIYQPKIPYIHITYAHLNKLNYDQTGSLEVEMAITIAAENHNAKADAVFSAAGFILRFHDIEVAQLRADAFDVAKNSSLPLNYVVQSSVIPLDEGAMDEMDIALKQEKISFTLNGQTRTRWRVGIFLSVKFLLHMPCQLQFAPFNGSSVGGVGCSSKSH
ncbi:NDR1/HIN1-like protein 12 [Phalaenopsis equestris]|uniref:NDR1/HIN1-like protein 12 n=1 Tax=Phalaenopsis equestris TaxID=78828 RepID=UPI0009E4B6A9|nr:NDR1/HIN1-like protein 12 [Phalaenopsis equestris]